MLAARPAAEAALEHFRLETVDTPPVPEGHLLVRVHYLSLDPYMRMRMNDAKSYVAPVGIGEVMVGGTVGEVAKVDASRVPLSAFLGAVGMPGVTAWVGLNHIIEAKAGETVVEDRKFKHHFSRP